MKIPDVKDVKTIEVARAWLDRIGVECAQIACDLQDAKRRAWESKYKVLADPKWLRSAEYALLALKRKRQTMQDRLAELNRIERAKRNEESQRTFLAAMRSAIVSRFGETIYRELVEAAEQQIKSSVPAEGAAS